MDHQKLVKQESHSSTIYYGTFTEIIKEEVPIEVENYIYASKSNQEKTHQYSVCDKGFATLYEWHGFQNR